MKIIGFDSWLGGVRFYNRLHGVVCQNESEIELIHLSSWNSNTFSKSQDLKIKTKDISSYKYNDFEKILKIEKPDIVYFLSTDVFAHRAMIRACRRNKIPTVHQYHGIMSVLADESGSTYDINIISQLKFIVKRINKFFTKVMPSYLREIVRDEASLKDFKTLILDTIKFAAGRAPTRMHLDSRTDLCLVYTLSDKNHAIRKYGYKEEMVKVVGNPDLIDFNFSKEMLNSVDSTQKNNFSYVLYLDTALYFRGACFSSLNEYENYLKTIKHYVNKNGHKFAIKLHPEYSKTKFHERLEKIDITVVNNSNFIEYIKQSVAVITEPTSVSIVPALMGWPLYLNNYGLLKNQEFGKILNNYPRSKKLNDIEEICFDLKLTTKENINEWLKQNRGKFPPENFDQRIYAYLNKLVSKF